MGDLVYKGINYDTGTNYVGGSLSRATLPADVVRRDLTAIRDELHCTSVNLFGTDIGRLTDTAAAALEAGLHVWLQPRLVEAEADAMLDHLAEAADAAERLRQRHGRIDLNLGCELTVFGAGIIPGDTNADRAAKLALPAWWPRFPAVCTGSSHRRRTHPRRLRRSSSNGYSTPAAWAPGGWS